MGNIINDKILLVEYVSSSMSSLGFGMSKTTSLYKCGSDKYELHIKYPGENDATSKEVSEDIYNKVMDYINEVNLKSYEGQIRPAIMGGIVSVKFNNGDRMIAITSNNVDAADINILYKVDSILCENMGAL